MATYPGHERQRVVYSEASNQEGSRAQSAEDDDARQHRHEDDASDGRSVFRLVQESSSDVLRDPAIRDGLGDLVVNSHGGRWMCNPLSGSEGTSSSMSQQQAKQRTRTSPAERENGSSNPYTLEMPTLSITTHTQTDHCKAPPASVAPTKPTHTKSGSDRDGHSFKWTRPSSSRAICDPGPFGHGRWRRSSGKQRTCYKSCRCRK